MLDWKSNPPKATETGKGQPFRCHRGHVLFMGLTITVRSHRHKGTGLNRTELDALLNMSRNSSVQTDFCLWTDVLLARHGTHVAHSVQSLFAKSCSKRADTIRYDALWLKFQLPITYTIQQYHLIFFSTKELTPEATTIKWQNHSFH